MTKGKQSIVAVVALVVYTGAILALGRQVQLYAWSLPGATAKAASGGEHSGCGMMSDHGCGEMQPAVVSSVIGLRKQVAAKDSASFDAAIKRHKAAVEKANAELAASLAGLAQLKDEQKANMRSMLNVTTGIQSPAACGGHSPANKKKSSATPHPEGCSHPKTSAPPASA